MPPDRIGRQTLRSLGTRHPINIMSGLGHRELGGRTPLRSIIQELVGAPSTVFHAVRNGADGDQLTAGAPPPSCAERSCFIVFFARSHLLSSMRLLEHDVSSQDWRSRSD